MMLEELREAITTLLQQAGFGTNYELFPLKGGRNNRVFRFESEDGTFLLKKYFYHQKDTRDRLNTEYSFLTYLWNNNIRSIPEPIIADKINRIGLYSFLEGRKAAGEDVQKQLVQQAVDFFLSINEHRQSAEAQKLPLASEACLSIEKFFYSVEWRLSRLSTIEVHCSIDNDAKCFIAQKIVPRWESIKKDIIHNADYITEELELDEWILSPSDFGFHNAIYNNEKIYFIDFEYAGWDDGVKMISDFFMQPDIPVGMEYFDDFLEQVLTLSKKPDKYIKRLKLMFPLVQLKWCCLLLNDFLKVASERRKFSTSGYSFLEHKENQLKKSTDLFAKISEGYYSI